jgi:hypothetical protein
MQNGSTATYWIYLIYLRYTPSTTTTTTLTPFNHSTTSRSGLRLFRTWTDRPLALQFMDRQTVTAYYHFIAYKFVRTQSRKDKYVPLREEVGFDGYQILRKP